MHETIIDIIEKELKKANIKLFFFNANIIYILILYIKYLCDNNIEGFNYDEIIKQNTIKETLNKLNKKVKIETVNGRRFYDLDKLKETSLNKTLQLIKPIDTYELTKEMFVYTETVEDVVFKYCYKFSKLSLHIYPNEKIEEYDLTSEHATYYGNNLNGITPLKRKYNYFKIIDTLLNKKSDYIEKLPKNLSKFDNIIIKDTTPIYRFKNKNNIIDDIENLFREHREFKGKIILKTRYEKISKLQNYLIINKYLSKVIFFENPHVVIMEFNSEIKEEITLILLNSTDISNENKLSKILLNNKTKKGQIIKVKPKDIIENNYRIGFKMYTLENKTEVKKINEIIDENTDLTSKLEELNKEIEVEISKLIVK